MIPGTVTMSLSDVDALRKQITDKDKDIELARKEIADIRAEKRVLKVTKPLNKDRIRITVPFWKAETFIRKLENLGKRGYLGASSYNDYVDVTSDVEVSVKDYESSEYVNFEDVKTQLEEELDKKYLGELGKLKTILGNYEVARSEENEKRNIQVQQLTIDYEKKLKDLNIIIVEEKQKYEDLENDKKRISREEELTEKIVKLQEKLQNEMNKSWWRKLLGLK